MLRHTATVAAVALLAAGAGAQSPQAGSHNPAVKNGAPHTLVTPARGANSFSRDQAMGRFAKAGYTRVSGLTKRDGLWRGTAMKAGKSTTVMLDYKGNITVR